MLSIAHLASCSRGAPDFSRIFDGTNNVQLVRAPQVVTAWRTAAWFKGDRARSPEDLFQKAGEPVLVPANLSTQLSRVLLDKNSYFSGPGGKDSVPLPIVVIRFSDSNRTLEVFFSFADDNFMIKTDRVTPVGLPEWVGGDFEPSRGELLRIVKRLFPSDKRMQALDETRADGNIWPRSWQPE